MKKTLLFLLMLLTIIVSLAVTITADGYTESVGHYLFTPSDIIEYASAGTGLVYSLDTYRDVDAVKAELSSGSLIGYISVPYYSEPALDASKYTWIKIKYAYNDEGSKIDYMKFFATRDLNDGEDSNLINAFKTFDISNGEGKWREVIINLDNLIFEDGKEWSETRIRRWQIYPFEDNAAYNAAIYIAGIGFFESESDAKRWSYTPQPEAVPETQVKPEPKPVTPTPAPKPVTPAPKPETKPVTPAPTPTPTPVTPAPKTVAPTPDPAPKPVTPEPEPVKTNLCGENLTWELDQDGTLTISGSGKMDDYGDTRETRAPWYIKRISVKTVVISEGVTHIGTNAFKGCENLTEVVMPKELTSIGDGAFSGCTSYTQKTLGKVTSLLGDVLTYANTISAEKQRQSAEAVLETILSFIIK